MGDLFVFTFYVSRFTPLVFSKIPLYNSPPKALMCLQRTKTMRKTSPLLAAVALAAALAAGCAGPEHKFGRGMSNVFEIVRHGEARRPVQQTALIHGPEVAYTTG